MKTANALALAAISLSGSASAFTLDFSSFAIGTELDNNIVVNVPGYGDVRFTEGPFPPTDAEIGNQYFGLPGIEFENGESVFVTFEGAPATNVAFAFVGVGNGEMFTATSLNSATPGDGAHSITFSGEGAALFAVEFDAAPVPEPSSTILVALSALGLVARRRR